jgi:tetratricopeptide (TPR) repeat protein
MKYTYVILLLSLVLNACQQAPENLQLGEAHLPNSGLEKAKPYFEQGLLLLHSFEYEDARAAFLEAQQKDTEFAMAYWGEAMTYNQPIWHRQQYEKGQEALQKLGESEAVRLEKAPTQIEKDLLGAVHILFGEGEKAVRDSAYAVKMGQLSQKYPNNQEVAAFHALSLLGAVQEGRDTETFARSAAIAQGILKENGQHPGALHYLIHSYDDPQHAHLAINAADSYAGVAPDAAHALHMPSHIYVAMGMWDKVISSNIASYQASVKRMEEKGLDTDARSYHALHWLMYGYLQTGEYDKARQILMEMTTFTDELPSKQARSYLIRMKGNYLVETGDWDDKAAAEINVDLDELNISQQAIHYFVEGMLAYRSKNEATLTALIDTLKQDVQQAQLSVVNKGAPMCGAVSSYQQPTNIDVGQAQVITYQLEALMAQLQGDDLSADEKMKAAVALQDELNYSYGPPEIVCPAYEFYAQWLSSQGRMDEAMEQYKRSLERGPGRLLPTRAVKEI